MPNSAGIWTSAALRQVVPVIGVCMLGWEPIRVLLFYFLDVLLRVPVWVAFVQRGVNAQDPGTTSSQRRVGAGLFTFAGMIPLLVVAVFMVWGSMGMGSEAIDLLQRGLPTTTSDGAMFALAIGLQIYASARSLRTPDAIPAEREDFFAEAKYRFALLSARTFLLLPACLVPLLADELWAKFLIAALAVALTVYDANPRLFLSLMARVFHDNKGGSLWSTEDDAAEARAMKDEAARRRSNGEPGE